MSEALRVCLALAVAAGLVAAATPAVQNAKVARSDAAARTAVDSLADAIADLAASSDPVPPGVDGATRTLTLSVPSRSATAAGPVTLFVGRSVGDGPERDAVGYRVADQPRHWLSLPVDVRRGGAAAGDDRPVRLEGDETVTLRFVRLDGRPTVLVDVTVSGASVQVGERGHRAYAWTARPVPGRPGAGVPV